MKGLPITLTDWVRVAREVLGHGQLSHMALVALYSYYDEQNFPGFEINERDTFRKLGKWTEYTRAELYTKFVDEFFTAEEKEELIANDEDEIDCLVEKMGIHIEHGCIVDGKYEVVRTMTRRTFVVKKEEE